jgi:N-sulfoglucosamine sulfohydrolase
MPQGRKAVILISFIIVSGLGLLLLPVMSFTRQQKRTNILLIMSDNHSRNHVGAYGDKVVKTPNIDKLASQGIRFTHAFCASPSCTPARAALLTGQEIWRLKDGANLWGTLPAEFKVYPDLLEENGYQTGYEGKGWGPGNYQAAGRKRNPGGDLYKSFESFLSANKASGGKPWTYWFSSKDPHRPYEVGSGKRAGIDPDRIKVPPYLPDHAEVRGDIADYYAAIQHFDGQVGELIRQLKAASEYENTLIVVCSDNGWQIPRGQANLYDFGTRVPLIIAWPERIKTPGIVDELVSLNDLAPTFLQIAGLEIPRDMTAKSIVPLLERGKTKDSKLTLHDDFIVMARERHAFVRQNGLGYPARAIRTRRYLFIRNYEPDRWPAGDPPLYGDLDAHMLHYPAPTKFFMLKNKDEKTVKPLFDLGFARRPVYELYDLHKDPDQLKNVAGKPGYQTIQNELSQKMEEYLTNTKDPRALHTAIIWDTAPYYNDRDKKPRPGKEAIERLNLKEEYDYLK